jgi:hypothetical protein
MAKLKLDIDELPSNSISSRVAPMNTVEMNEEKAIVVQSDEEAPVVKKKKKIKAIVAKQKEPSFMETFFGESAKEVIMYVLYDVLIPAAKTTIQDMVTTGIEMFLFGEGGTAPRRRGEGSHISYSNFYQRNSRRDRGYGRHTSSASSRIDGISFESRESAKAALEALLDLFGEYDQVSVADYYEIVGLNDRIVFTDRRIGWEENINRARVVPGRNGFIIDLPRPKELE